VRGIQPQDCRQAGMRASPRPIRRDVTGVTRHPLTPVGQYVTVTDSEPVIHYTASVHANAKSRPMRDDEPFSGDLPRYMCCFCNLPTDDQAAHEVAYLHAFVTDRSQVISLGAHLECLRRAVHPKIAESRVLSESGTNGGA
jgi:hypothetical protein